MRFYTNVSIHGSNVLVREVVDGIPNKRKVVWHPTLYVSGKPNGDASASKTIYGKDAYSVQPGTVPECRDFVKRYSDVSGFEIFGQLNYALQYMNEYKPTTWVYKHISVWGVDIETAIPIDDEGKTSFPTPEKADGKVTLITLINMQSGDKFTFGTKPCNIFQTQYLGCITEEELFRQFMAFWEKCHIDIITGWNIAQFDIPYLYNRMCKVMNDEFAKRLSPWGRVNYRENMFKGRKEYDVELVGISILDMIDAYKKYTFIKQESYSLDNIATVELGHTKLHVDYIGKFVHWQTLEFPAVIGYTHESGDSDIKKKIKDRNFLIHSGAPQKQIDDANKLLESDVWHDYVHYNVIDAQLVKQLNDKLKLIELILTMAYEAKINYEDVSSPVKLWDAIIHNYCLDRNIVVPQGTNKGSSESLDGAYVKEPVPGWYENVITQDARSLYPSIMMTNNISPETYVGRIEMTVDEFLSTNETFSPDVVTTPIGAMYSKQTPGIFSELIKYYMKKRSTAKKEMLRLEQELELVKQELSDRNLT